MAESKPQSLDVNQEEEGINALLGGAEEAIESVFQKEISSSSSSSNSKDQQKEETDHIIDDTSIINTHDVKAPNLFDRAKEEIAAIVQTIHTKNNDNQLEDTTTRSVSDADSLLQGKFEKVVNLIERGKEEMVAILSKRKEKSAANQSETHGLRDDIDENTPLSEVKGPTVFERAKEEFEAIVNAIHPKKESISTTTTSSDNIVDAGPSSSSSEGFWLLVGRQLEKFCCSPFHGKKD